MYTTGLYTHTMKATPYQVSDQISSKVRVTISEEGEGSPLLPSPARPANAMDVCVYVLGHVKVDDGFDGWNVKASSCSKCKVM